VVSGKPGSGKTTALAHLTLTLASNAHEYVPLSYFCSSRLRGSSLSPRQFTATIAEQLHAAKPALSADLPASSTGKYTITGTATAQTVSGSAAGVLIEKLVTLAEPVDDIFLKSVSNPLARLAKIDSRRVVLIVDALDESKARSTESIHDLILKVYAGLPDNCSVVVSSQNRPDLIRQLTALDDSTQMLDLSAPSRRSLVDADIRAMATVRLRAIARPAVEIDDLSGRIVELVQGNFLHARLLLDQLEDDPSRAHALVTISTAPAELKAYHLSLFDRLKNDHETQNSGTWSTLCQPVLSLLSVARRPLTVAEVSPIVDLDAGQVATALTAIRPVLEASTIDGAQAYALANASVTEFLAAPVLESGMLNGFAVIPGEAEYAICQRVVNTSWIKWIAIWYIVEYLASHYLSVMTSSTMSPDRLRTEDWLTFAAAQLRRSAHLHDPDESVTALVRVLQSESDNPLLAFLTSVDVSTSPQYRSAIVNATRSIVSDLHELRQIIRALLENEDRAANWIGGQLLLDHPADAAAAILAEIATADSMIAERVAYSLPPLMLENPERVSGTLLTPIVDSISIARPLRTSRLVRFMANASITAYICHCDRPEVARATSDLWEDVFKNRLHLGKPVTNMLMKPVSAIASEALARQMMTHRAAGQLFEASMSTEQSALIASLIPALDPSQPLPRADLVAALHSESTLVNLLAAMVLAGISMTDARAGHQHCRDIWPRATSRARRWMMLAHAVLLKDTPTPWVRQLWAMYKLYLRDYAMDRASDISEALWPIALPLNMAKHRTRLHSWVSIASDQMDPLRSQLFTGIAGAGLFYPEAVTDAFLIALSVDERTTTLNAISRSARTIRILHPRQADLVLEVMRDHAPSEPALDEAGVYELVALLGLYNNGVHQCIYYPRMRSTLIVNAFNILRTSANEAAFVRSYAPVVLRFLIESDYRLLNWTLT
jgi:hypothetical protein